MLKMQTEQCYPNQRYVKVDDFRKQVFLASVKAGKAEVVWTKTSPGQPDKVRQIIKAGNHKYMVHFWKNKVTEIYLIQRG